LYHIVPDATYGIEDIKVFPGSFYATAYEGFTINPYVSEHDGLKVFSREKRLSEVIAAGLDFDKGVIHTIGSLLLPPENANSTSIGMGFTYFYGAVDTTGLAKDLVDANGIAVFIPTNDAFIKVGSQLKHMSVEELSTLMQFHMVPDTAYFTTNLSDGDSLNTLAFTPYTNGIDIRVDEDDGELHANNARVTTANILLSNGVAHLVNRVMNPRNDEEGYYHYKLADDDQEGVPSFEGAASATIPSFTSGISTAAVGAFSPTATFSTVSGAIYLQTLNLGVALFFCGLAASAFAFFLV
jgi:hypothetical protein